MYGSRANGTHDVESDYDIAAFAASTSGLRIARKLERGYLDAFVYPDSVLADPEPEHLKMVAGRVLVDESGRPTKFLRSLDSLYRQGPAALPADEVQMRKAWAHKMVHRATRGDPEGDFRRAWLLTALIEDYFAIHRRWYEGPKKALAWLRSNEPHIHTAYVAALRPGSSIQKLRELVAVAYGPLTG